eukprot:GHUV01053940.1.p3 GENE.GHUV01053940.1~~GHUV01053940.1.p3  ORF type:complete len:108 (+),score=19.16 GHUV01053940.1:713-1036(+)
MAASQASISIDDSDSNCLTNGDRSYGRAVSVCKSSQHTSSNRAAVHHLCSILPHYWIVACQIVMLRLHIAQIDELRLADGLVRFPAGRSAGVRMAPTCCAAQAAIFE